MAVNSNIEVEAFDLARALDYTYCPYKNGRCISNCMMLTYAHTSKVVGTITTIIEDEISKQTVRYVSRVTKKRMQLLCSLNENKHHPFLDTCIDEDGYYSEGMRLTEEEEAMISFYDDCEKD